MATMGHGVLNFGSCAQGEGEKEWGARPHFACFLLVTSAPPINLPL
jgi:hypothetical protein